MDADPPTPKGYGGTSGEGMKLKNCNGPGCEGMERPYADFDPDIGQPDNLQEFCRACAAEINKQGPQDNEQGEVRMDAKTCRKCKREKPVDAFGKDVRTIDGHAQTCSECRSKEHGKRKGTAIAEAPARTAKKGTGAAGERARRAKAEMERLSLKKVFRDLVKEAIREVVRERFDELVGK